MAEAHAASVSRTASNPVWLDPAFRAGAVGSKERSQSLLLSEHRANYTAHPLSVLPPQQCQSSAQQQNANGDGEGGAAGALHGVGAAQALDFSQILLMGEPGAGGSIHEMSRDMPMRGPYQSLQSEHRDHYVKPGTTGKEHYRTRRGMIEFSKDPLETVSDYRGEFTAKQSEKYDMSTSDARKSHVNLAFDSDHDLQSIYRNDYQRRSEGPPKRGEQLSQLLNNNRYKPSRPLPQSLTTTTVPVEPATLAANHYKTDRTLSDAAQMDPSQQTTDYKANYMKWQQTREYLAPARYSKPVGHNPEANRSMYKTEFRKFQNGEICRSEPVGSVLSGSLTRPGQQFHEGRSVYKEDFIPKPISQSDVSVLTNKGSLMHTCGPENWWEAGHVDTLPYVEYTDQLFYHT